MDSLTHVGIGGCISAITPIKKLGKKGLILGAVAQNLPDIDFIASYFLPVSRDVIFHRSITHSIIFVIISSFLLAAICGKLYSKLAIGYKSWLLFWLLQLFVHILIDSFNVYGTGWFEPFYRHRISFNIFYVSDPLFFIWPVGVFFYYLFTKIIKPKYAWCAVVISVVYTIYGVGIKLKINKKVEENFRSSNIFPVDYIVTPTPLNNQFWYIVSKDSLGSYTGYTSVNENRPIHFCYTPKNDSLKATIVQQEAVHQLERFSQGYYTYSFKNNKIVINDLRFGEIQGWNGGCGQFIFYYYFDNDDDNKAIVQRGRMMGWNRQSLQLFWRKIIGQ